MREKNDISAKAGMIAIMVFFLAITGLFVFWFFNCIKAHSEFDVDYSDLIYEELTFDQYEKVGAGKSGHAYKIYFREYKEAFRVDAITRKKLDEEALDDLAQNVRVEVYFCATSSKQCEYKICEMRCDGVVLLTLEITLLL